MGDPIELDEPIASSSSKNIGSSSSNNNSKIQQHTDYSLFGQEPLLPDPDAELPLSPSLKIRSRIIALDQFRGYTLLSMILVNFLSHYTKRAGGNIPNNFAHMGTYANYPDTIMPHFVFMAGLTLRMSALKIINGEPIIEDGIKLFFKKTARRFFGLLVISLIIYALIANDSFKTWDQLTSKTLKQGLIDFFVSDFWETLIQIAFSMLFISPVIYRTGLTRVIFMVLTFPLPSIFTMIIYKNTDKMLANNPAGEGGCLAWMGGWSFLMLAGSLTHDIIKWNDRDTASFRLFDLIPCLNTEHTFLTQQKMRTMNLVAWPLMIIGWFFSCFGMILNFDVCVNGDNSRGLRDVATASIPCEGFVWYQAPPFFPSNNPITMWTMSSFFPSISTILFQTGFTLFLFSISYYIWDIKNAITVPLFTTFGTNSILTYIISIIVEQTALSKQITPYDSPAIYVLLVGFPIHLFLIWIIIRFAEKNRIFIAL